MLPVPPTWTVITHAVPIAALLAPLPHVELHLLPGRVRTATQAAVGHATVEAIRHYRADLAFVGTNGISVQHGLSTPDPEEAATKHAIVESAQRVVVLADASKVGQERTVRFAALEDVDVLVTDISVDPADVTRLRGRRPGSHRGLGHGHREPRRPDRHPHRQPELRPHGRAAAGRWSAEPCTGSRR